MPKPSLEARLEEVLSEVATLRRQVASQQTRLNELEGRPAIALPEANTTSRRRMLRRLADGLVAGLALGGAALANGGPAQASTVINPASGSLKVGAIVVPPSRPLRLVNHPPQERIGTGWSPPTAHRQY